MILIIINGVKALLISLIGFKLHEPWWRAISPIPPCPWGWLPLCTLHVHSSIHHPKILEWISLLDDQHAKFMHLTMWRHGDYGAYLHHHFHHLSHNKKYLKIWLHTICVHSVFLSLRGYPSFSEHLPILHYASVNHWKKFYIAARLLCVTRIKLETDY